MAILYAQRQLRLHTSWTPQQVLTQRIPGTYTTALVTPRFEVVDWGLHKERLMRYDAVHGRRSAVALHADEIARLQVRAACAAPSAEVQGKQRWQGWPACIVRFWPRPVARSPHLPAPPPPVPPPRDARNGHTRLREGLTGA